MDVNIRTMEERDLPAASRIYNQSAVATTYSYTVVNTNVEDRLATCVEVARWSPMRGGR